MKTVSYSAALAALALSGCASLGDSLLVAFSIPDKERSGALSRTAVGLYAAEVVTESDLSALPKVKKYLEAALRVDPANEEAKKYLALAEDFQAGRFSAAMAKFRGLYAKPSRTREEEHALHASLRRAAAFDPADEDVRRFVKETADARGALVKSYLAKASETRKAAAGDAPKAARDRAATDAFNLASRAAEIDPENAEVKKAWSELRSAVDALIVERLETVGAAYGKGAFADAKTQLALLKDLDAKIGKPHRSELRDAEFGLYFAWASYHAKRKEWLAAESRIVVARSLKKTSEAAELAAAIAAARAAEEKGSSFASGLRNLDAMLQNGDPAGAQRLAAALGKSAQDAESKRAVEERRRNIRTALDQLFERGVAAYKEERFKESAADLKTVVDVDPAYPSAAEYLEKALAKQKLLELY